MSESADSVSNIARLRARAPSQINSKLSPMDYRQTMSPSVHAMVIRSDWLFKAASISDATYLSREGFCEHLDEYHHSNESTDY